MQQEQEEPLSGGHVSKVVRIGNTVRRSTGPWTPTIHRLLAYVRAKGLRWVPEPLGLDGSGREVLSYIPGTVPHDRPEWLWTERVLTDVAVALRAWHDATIDFPVTDAVWGLPSSSTREVICHNDFAPYNCVFDGGRFVGTIDFDFCSPGSRLWDLAYTAYRFVPLMPGPDETPTDSGERSPFGASVMRERLETFLAAYGSGDAVVGSGIGIRFGAETLVRTAIDRLRAIADWTEDFARRQGASALAGHALMYRGHAMWLGSGFGPGAAGAS